MNVSTLSFILSCVALALAIYAMMIARDGADAARSTVTSISRVQGTQSVMQGEWTKTSTELADANSAISQMLNELYANQELMAEFLGIEVESKEEEKTLAGDQASPPIN